MFVYRNGNTDPPKDVLQVVIDPSVTYIKVCAFEQCRALTSVTIRPSVTHIGDSAFMGCTSLISVHFSKSTLKFIGDQAFQGCKALIYINIPSSVNFVGDHSFYECDSLLSVITTYRDIFGMLKDRFVNFPLHDECASMDITVESIQRIVENVNNCIHHEQKEPIEISTLEVNSEKAKIILTDPWGLTPLHVICCNIYAKSSMIQQIVEYLPPKVTTMKTVSDGKTPLELYKLCRKETPYELSLIVALKLGMSWMDIKKMMKEGTLDSLEQGIVDEATLFSPFMLAAIHPVCDLEALYRLALYNVDNLVRK